MQSTLYGMMWCETSIDEHIDTSHNIMSTVEVVPSSEVENEVPLWERLLAYLRVSLYGGYLQCVLSSWYVGFLYTCPVYSLRCYIHSAAGMCPI